MLMRLVRKFSLKVTNSPIKQLKAANGTGIDIEGATEVPLVVVGQSVQTNALVSGGGMRAWHERELERMWGFEEYDRRA